MFCLVGPTACFEIEIEHQHVNESIIKIILNKNEFFLLLTHLLSKCHENKTTCNDQSGLCPRNLKNSEAGMAPTLFAYIRIKKSHRNLNTNKYNKKKIVKISQAQDLSAN